MSIDLAYAAALLLCGVLLSAALAADARTRSFELLGVEVTDRHVRRFGLVERAGRYRRGIAFLAYIAAGAVVGGRMLGPVGVAAGSIGGALVTRWRARRAELGTRALLDRQLGEAVGAMAAALRAGLSVRLSVAEAARGASPPLLQELESVVTRLDTGEPLDQALTRLDRRLGLSDAGLLVSALSVHRRTGGDLPVLLDEIEGFIRTRHEDRGVARALTAQARSSGVVLAVLPIAFVALLSGTGGDGLGAFYRTPSGVALLLISGCLQALGFVWMRQIVRRVESP